MPRSGTIVREMAARAGTDGGFVAHPYPVTPWHGDYLHPCRSGGGGARAACRQRRRAICRGRPQGEGERCAGEAPRAARVARRWRGWDVAIERNWRHRTCSSPSAPIVNGWLGPRWTRSGWFHAHRLLSGCLSEPQHKAARGRRSRAAQSGEIEDTVERANLERDLVGALTAGCRAVVAGYT